MTKDKSSIADKKGRVTPRVAIPARRREPASLQDAKTWDELKAWVDNNADFNLYNDTKDADLEALKESVAAIVEFEKEFPEVAPYIGYLAFDETQKGAMGGASYGPGLHMGVKYYIDKKVLDAEYEHGVSTHFHPEGTTSKDVFIHELGHKLNRILIDKAHPLTGTIDDAYVQYDRVHDWNNNLTAESFLWGAVELAHAEYGLPKKWGIRRASENVSRYAKSDPAEGIAECVADYWANKDKAKPLSRAVWRMLKEQIQGN